MRTLLVAALTVAFVPAARADPDPPSPDVPDTTPAPPEPPAAEAPAPAPLPAVAPPALTPVMAPVPMIAQPQDRTAAYIATGATGVALIGAVVCLVKFNQSSEDAGKIEPGRLGTDTDTKLRATIEDADSWRTRTLMMGGVVLVGAVVSGYFWGEADPKRPTVNVHPTTDGAAVSLSGRF